MIAWNTLCAEAESIGRARRERKGGTFCSSFDLCCSYRWASAVKELIYVWYLYVEQKRIYTTARGDVFCAPQVKDERRLCRYRGKLDAAPPRRYRVWIRFTFAVSIIVVAGAVFGSAFCCRRDLLLLDHLLLPFLSQKRLKEGREYCENAPIGRAVYAKLNGN